MSKSPIPLLMLGGAALLLIGGRKARATTSSTPAPGATLHEDPIPEKRAPSSSPSSVGLSESGKNQLLIDLGYQGLHSNSIMAFQNDWNAMMVWLWDNNPNIDKNTPKYGLIGTDGKWGKITEARALRAIDHVPRGGTIINIDDANFHVASFRDMVQKVKVFVPKSPKQESLEEKIPKPQTMPPENNINLPSWGNKSCFNIEVHFGGDDQLRNDIVDGRLHGGIDLKENYILPDHSFSAEKIRSETLGDSREFSFYINNTNDKRYYFYPLITSNSGVFTHENMVTSSKIALIDHINNRRPGGLKLYLSLGRGHDDVIRGSEHSHSHSFVLSEADIRNLSKGLSVGRSYDGSANIETSTEPASNEFYFHRHKLWLRCSN